MTLGPFSVNFPVNFSSGGDTTKKAFKKHIDEINKIYDTLNALNADKVSASDVSGLSGSITGVSSQLTTHINSSTPHPNWKPTLSSLDGNLDVSRITGNWPLSRTTGTLDASKVSGKLTNATIDAAKVNGLTAAITSQIPASDGIMDSSLADNGYIKFGNGLIIQWGYFEANQEDLVKDGLNDNWDAVYNFPISFQSKCYSMNVFRPSSYYGMQFGFELRSRTTSSFTVRYRDISNPQPYHTRVNILAIGN